MYYLIKVDNKNWVGFACGGMATHRDGAFKFTSLLHAESVLASWQANHPTAQLVEVAH